MGKKLTSMNKTVKLILHELEQTISFEHEAVERKRNHGKPRGSSFEEKQASCLKMLNSKRIKAPKPQAMEFYHIELDKDKNMYLIM